MGVNPTISTTNSAFRRERKSVFPTKTRHSYILIHTIISKRYRKNHEIRVPEVRVIGAEGEQLGVMSTSEALKAALAANLDLVEVSPLAQPPVVKIVDFGKLQYEQEKQLRKNKAASKRIGEMKGIRLSVTIGEHDLMVRVKNGQKFLDKGYKLKIELQLRGRQREHPELAKKTIERYIELLERKTTTEQSVKQLGGRFSAIVSC